MNNNQGRDDSGKYASNPRSEPESGLPGHWPQGELVIDRMIQARELERVDPSNEHAQRLLDDAEKHLASADQITEGDPTAAFVLLYDSARKSLAAALAVQGLRATSRGAHIALQEALEAQLGQAKSVIKMFGQIRRIRNDADYPSQDTAPIAIDDIDDYLPKAKAIVEAMKMFIPRVGPF